MEGTAGRRFYIAFSRGRALRFLSHLDMMRLWERALRRAQLPPRYSQGYHPHPRLSLALPLAVGMTADEEWLEAELGAAVLPEEVHRRLAGQLPPGLALLRVQEAPWRASPLAGRVQGGEYQVEIKDPPPRAALLEQVGRFLSSETWPVQEEHKGRQRTVDLRRGVIEAEVEAWASARARVRLLLRHGPQGGARPETVVRAWGVESAVLLHRRRLWLGSC